MLTAMSASAALNITERTAPVLDYSTLPALPAPVKSELATDGATVQYYYNTGLNAYFADANNWKTRATALVERGMQIKLTPTTDGCYAIENYVTKFSEWRKTFAGGPTDIWTDNKTGANCDAWSVKVNADGTFTLANEAAAAGAVLGGVVGDVCTLGTNEATEVGTYLNLYVAETENFHYTWYAVSETDYAANITEREPIVTKRDELKAEYDSLTVVYNAAVALYNALNEADAAGVAGLDEYVAVYNNAASTTEELEKTTVAVNDAIAAAAAGTATADKPADLTNKLANPTLDENVSGWSGTGMAHGYASGEHYNKTYDTYQTLENMPAGVYALGLTGYYRAGNSGPSWDHFKANTGKNALLYAIDKKADAAANDTLTSPICNIYQGITPNNSFEGNESQMVVGEDTYYVPNNMETAKKYFDAGYYKDNKVFFQVSEGTAQLGVKKETTIGGDWTMFGDFTLTYYGAGADAYTLWYGELLKNVTTYSEEDQITGSVLEAFNTAVTEAKNVTVTNMEEVMANYAKVEEAQKVVEANVAAWTEYMFQYAEAQKAAANGELAGPSMDALNDYLFDAEDIVNEKSLNNEELIAEAEKLKNMIAEAIQNSIQPGTVYDQLKNTDFSEGNKYWTSNATAINSSAKCAESYDQESFDIYQTVENAPVGIYTVSVQAFGRALRGDDAWKKYYDPTTGEKLPNVEPIGAYIYMNDNKTTLPNVFEYPVANEMEEEKPIHIYKDVMSDLYVDPNGEYVYPNTMAQAGVAFQQGEDVYKVETFGLVAKKGDALRIGVKGSTRKPISPTWAIFTNFKLVFWGTQTDKVAPRLKDIIDAIDLTAPMGADVIEKATALKTAGEAAYAATPQDGKVMFDALAEILHYNDSITTSVALFAELNEAIVALQEYAPEAPNAKVKDEAIAYAEDVNKNIATYKNADAEEAIAKLAEYMTKLSYPADYDKASDDNAADFTGVLKSPSFEKDGTNSIEGWTVAKGNYNFGNDDTQKAALALEFYQNEFDMYQTIPVPNGTYMVTVKAFARNSGGAQADYELWAAGTPTTAMLYAVSADETKSVALEHQASDNNASTEALGGASYTHDELTFYVPNSMTEFRAFVDDNAERYLNKLYIKVTDEKLTIGFKGTTSQEWVIMDDVTLTYYGTNSTLNIEGVENFETPAKVEFFQINGTQAAALKKGFNIVRMTDANGNVKVKKVIVK